MNVFYRFTRRSLAKNKVRTLVTVIGIVLSMALFTAVIEGAYSGVRFLIRGEEADTGAFHAVFYGLTREEAERAGSYSEISESAALTTVGWAKSESINGYKPYLLICSAGEGFTDMVSVKITEGRMPENENELLMPQHYRTNGGADFSVGDTLTLEVGKRTMDGEEIGSKVGFSCECGPDGEVISTPEEITDAVSVTYTVVGVYERFSTYVEDFLCPGYTALTVGKAEGKADLFFTVGNISGIYDFLNSQDLSDDWTTHNSLLTLYGNGNSEGINVFITGFVIILIILIALGSVSLIYNSFSISVSERTKQFGILKSVGATKKQIRSSVLYEALILCGISIPLGLALGCGGIGLTLYLLRDAFSGFTLSKTVKMGIVLHPGMLLIAAMICLATTLISAFIPAKRAMRVDPIDSIRQSSDLKIKKNEIKVSPLTEKLFGFEGMMASKNFKRNRKRYRSTVISLTLSILLFISASSFTAYLTDAVNTVSPYARMSDVTYSYWSENEGGSEEEEKTAMTVFETIKGLDGVDDAVLAYVKYSNLNLSAADLASGALTDEAGSQSETCYGSIDFIDDGYFRSLCRESGLDPDRYFDPDSPRAVMYNFVDYFNEEREFTHARIFEESALPLKVNAVSVSAPDGMTLMDIALDVGTGETFYSYLPDATAEKYYKGELEEFPESEQLLIPAEEAEVMYPNAVEGFIESPPIGSESEEIRIIYPYSQLGNVALPDNDYGGLFSVQIIAKDHVKAYDELNKAIEEGRIRDGMSFDVSASVEQQKMIITVVNVFAYGFIILISLICAANVFNTISTNISLRRREFATLRSVGQGTRSFRRMLNYECVIYGVKGLLWGLPFSFISTFLIFRQASNLYERSFYVPWHSVLIAVGSVFAVVFATMLYAGTKIRRENTADALKNDNL